MSSEIRPVKVLLVFGDKSLRESFRDYLEISGHIVIEARNNILATPLFSEAKKQGEPFELVITGLRSTEGHLLHRDLRDELDGCQFLMMDVVHDFGRLSTCQNPSVSFIQSSASSADEVTAYLKQHFPSS